MTAKRSSSPKRTRTQAAGLLFLLPLLLAPLTSQQPSFTEAWRWSRFGTREGLPSSEVHQILARGPHVWVGTARGLAWFDGYHWHAAGHALGLPEAIPRALARGTGNLVWAIIEGKLYRITTQSSKQLSAPPMKPGQRLTNLAFLHDGDLLVERTSAAGEGTLFRLHNGIWRPFPLPPDPSPPFGGTHLEQTRNGTIWLQRRRGLYRWKRRAWQLFLQGGPTQDSLDLLEENAHETGCLSVRYPPERCGLWIWDKGQAARHQNEHHSCIQRSLAIDAAGGMLMVEQTGQVLWREAGRWTPLTRIPETLRRATVLAFDPSGDLWAGTPAGLLLCRLQERLWSTWPHARTGSSRNRIHDMFEARDKSIWLGTGRGVEHRDPRGRSLPLAELPTCAREGVTGLSQDLGGHIWASSGMAFGGLLEWDGQRWLRHARDAAGTRLGMIHRIRKDLSGKLWFLELSRDPTRPRASWGGVHRLEGGRILPWDQARRLHSERVYDFVSTPDGARWFATSRAVLRFKEGRWKAWHPRREHLPSRILSLAPAPEGGIWFLTGTPRLGRIDRQGRLTTFPLLAETGSHTFGAVAVGPKGQPWMSVGAHLFLKSPSGLLSLGPHDGLGSQETWPLLFQEDRLLVGTLGGGVRVLFLGGAQRRPPRLELESLQVAGASLWARWHPLGFKGFRPSLFIPTRYKLGNRPWSPWSRVHELGRTHLSPGENRLLVQARGLLGQVAHETLDVPFTIPAPFLRRPLVRLGLGALGISIVTLILLTWRHRRREARLHARLERRLLEMRHMKSLGLLAGGVAHDINNLLQVVMSSGELLATDIQDRPDLEGFVGEILKAADSGRGLTRQLLAFSQQQVVHPALLEVGSLVTSSLPMLKRLCGPSIKIQFQHSAAGCLVETDQTQLEQLILNLTVNARDAMPGGGELLIQMRPAEQRDLEALLLSPSHPGPFILLEVSDCGTGISPRVLNHLFEPFFTTKEEGKSRGLGLAAVWGIVERLQGGIGVQSKPGEGSTFSILLPRAQEGLPFLSRDPKTAPAASPLKSVLLVEDDNRIARIIKNALARSGYKVHTAQNAEQALAMVHPQGRLRPGLLITDVIMPGMHGPDLVQALRRHLPDLKVIIISGYTQDDSCGTLLKNRTTLFLQKPFRPSELLALVQKLAQQKAS